MKKLFALILILPMFLIACDSGRHIDQDERNRRLRETTRSGETAYIYSTVIEGDRLVVQYYLSLKGSGRYATLYIYLQTGKVYSRVFNILRDTGINVCTASPCESFEVNMPWDKVIGEAGLYGSTYFKFSRTKNKYRILRKIADTGASTNTNTDSWEQRGFADEILMQNDPEFGSPAIIINAQTSADRYTQKLYYGGLYSISFYEPLDGYSLESVALVSGEERILEAKYTSLVDSSEHKEIYKYELVQK
ncbi:hypothetical protein ACLVWU_01545 [Bdellovibrio sp. HCB290]|uniref:hypothetical protein n=1 Tax=Bdellovibrio sp. HCB290 TaxID=3394356 RepID=UPI0039B6C48E